MATNDVLKALLENELLTDDVKASVEAAFTAIVEEQKTIAEAAATEEAGKALNEALVEAKTKMEAEVRTELATKFVSEREELIKSLDEKVMELMTSEIEELKEDINSFRDLEVEMIAKLEDEKEVLAEKFASEKEIFIGKIDEFVEERLVVELTELNEDIQSIKKNKAGMQMFEAFVDTYNDTFSDGDDHMASVKAKLSTLEDENADVLAIAEALGEKVVKLERTKALEVTLASLSGKRKAVMSSILEGFDTDKFGAVYKKMITRVMDTVAVDGDTTEISESVDEDTIDEKEIEIVDGDSHINESVIEDEVDEVMEDDYAAIRKLAGISK